MRKKSSLRKLSPIDDKRRTIHIAVVAISRHVNALIELTKSDSAKIALRQIDYILRHQSFSDDILKHTLSINQPTAANGAAI